MEDREPTMRSYELGEALRAAMTAIGYDGARMARELGWSPSRVSRLLSGTRWFQERDVAAFLALCRVTGKERDRLLDIACEVDLRGWLERHGSRLPKQLRTLVKYEDKAIHIGDFQGMLVPGLLQTAEYARALIVGNAGVPEDELDERVHARLARQCVFEVPRPARCEFYVHELALLLPVGGAAVMSEQLHHLLRMSVRPRVRLRVVPAALGAHAGIAGQFTLMEFAAFHPVVYLESETSTLFLEEPEEVAAYRRILTTLADTALDEGQSRELITTLATTLYADGDDHDHPGTDSLGLAQE